MNKNLCLRFIPFIPKYFVNIYNKTSQIVLLNSILEMYNMLFSAFPLITVYNSPNVGDIYWFVIQLFSPAVILRAWAIQHCHLLTTRGKARSTPNKTMKLKMVLFLWEQFDNTQVYIPPLGASNLLELIYVFVFFSRFFFPEKKKMSFSLKKKNLNITNLKLNKTIVKRDKCSSFLL